MKTEMSNKVIISLSIITSLNTYRDMYVLVNKNKLFHLKKETSLIDKLKIHDFSLSLCIFIKDIDATQIEVT